MKRTGTDIDKQIGLRIRAARIGAGVTQERLGETLGVTFQQVQKYEKGINRCGPAALTTIASALGTTVPARFGCNDDRDAEVINLLASREGHALASAFNQIMDSRSRQAIVAIAERLAVTDGLRIAQAAE